MKIELKARIQAIIDAYHGNAQVHEAEIMKVVEPFKDKDIISKYTPEGLLDLQTKIQGKMGVVIDAWKKVDLVYNQKLKIVIADAKGQLLPMVVKPFTKPADYQGKISNAMKNLDDEGDSVNDEIAYMFLKDFTDDIEQMRIFKHRIGKRVELEDAMGNNTFPLTFGSLNKVEITLNTFNEIETLANTLFIYPKEQGQEVLRFNNVGYSTLMDSYEQLEGEVAIIDFATLIEAFAETIEN